MRKDRHAFGDAFGEETGQSADFEVSRQEDGQTTSGEEKKGTRGRRRLSRG